MQDRWELGLGVVSLEIYEGRIFAAHRLYIYQIASILITIFLCCVYINKHIIIYSLLVIMTRIERWLIFQISLRYCTDRYISLENRASFSQLDSVSKDRRPRHIRFPVDESSENRTFFDVCTSRRCCIFTFKHGIIDD